jgi:hypothetical protein
VAQRYLESRLELLRRSQNADGGWGYFPGKQSWLEPTAYAALALHGEGGAERAWRLLASWQAEDGRFRPASDVKVASWGAALFVTLAAAREAWGDPVRKAVEWLVETSGVESNWVNRMAARAGWLDVERDLSLQGWPWKPDTTSWVEPTAHALVALKKAAGKFGGDALQERIRLGQAQLMDLRCKDGGWNYGSRAALKVDLPSYPETTGLALLGLQGRPGLESALDVGSRMLEQAASPLGRAWLRIALRAHGATVADAPVEAMPADLQMVALEALAASEGNWRFFRTEDA